MRRSHPEEVLDIMDLVLVAAVSVLAMAVSLMLGFLSLKAILSFIRIRG